MTTPRPDEYPATIIRRRLPALLGLVLVVSLAAWSPTTARSGRPGRTVGSSAPVELVLGSSTQGRPIEAVRFGDGPRKLVLVSATHGWPERNTYQLALQLIEQFRSGASTVPDDVSLSLFRCSIPTVWSCSGAIMRTGST